MLSKIMKFPKMVSAAKFDDANGCHKEDGNSIDLDKMRHSKATLRTSPKDSEKIFILKTKAEVVDYQDKQTCGSNYAEKRPVKGF